MWALHQRGALCSSSSRGPTALNPSLDDLTVLHDLWSRNSVTWHERCHIPRSEQPGMEQQATVLRTFLSYYLLLLSLITSINITLIVFFITMKTCLSLSISLPSQSPKCCSLWELSCFSIIVKVSTFHVKFLQIMSVMIWRYTDKIELKNSM